MFPSQGVCVKAAIYECHVPITELVHGRCSSCFLSSVPYFLHKQTHFPFSAKSQDQTVGKVGHVFKKVVLPDLYLAIILPPSPPQLLGAPSASYSEIRGV